MSVNTCAYCWRSGLLEFGNSVPSGAFLIVKGPDEMVRDQISAAARHAYDGKSLLVPGIPEANNDREAEAALEAFLGRFKVRFLLASEPS